jgi:sulfur relay (sulfurtransferase) DsrF/TusC family protein
VNAKCFGFSGRETLDILLSITAICNINSLLFLDNKKSCTFKQKPIKIKRHCGISLGMLINNINHN